MKRKILISKIVMLGIFLALVRTIAEPLQLQYYSTTGLTFYQIKPFLIAALICAVGLFTMTLFFYYNKHRMVVMMAILIVTVLFIIKFEYGI